jgi:hypothetical protein
VVRLCWDITTPLSAGFFFFFFSQKNTPWGILKKNYDRPSLSIRIVGCFLSPIGNKNWHWPYCVFFLVTQLWTKPI